MVFKYTFIQSIPYTSTQCPDSTSYQGNKEIFSFKVLFNINKFEQISSPLIYERFQKKSFACRYLLPI